MTDISEYIFHSNASRDAIRGWFIGQFVHPASGLRRRTDLEVKWGVHAKGERRVMGWAAYKTSTTISVLIEGVFLVTVRVDAKTHDVLLQERGDYYILSPMVEHTWEAITDCVVLTVRCPSVAGDLIERPD